MAIETADLPRYYTASEVAQALRFSKERTLGLIRAGRIRAIREGRSFRISAEAVRDFEHTNPGQEPNPAVPVIAEERRSSGTA